MRCYPLTIGTAPLLLYLAMGGAGKPVFVSETRNLYQYRLNLLPMENCDCFDLVQDRGIERILFEVCRVQGFELRIMKGEMKEFKEHVIGRVQRLEKKEGERGKERVSIAAVLISSAADQVGSLRCARGLFFTTLE